MIVENRMLVSEMLGHKRAALLPTLKKHDVKAVIVTYAGAGDSGPVDGIDAIP